MTTLELFKKHRQGEVSRERFLYEVRRDSNLPWVTNTTSYDDAVKILKNKGIIRESAVVPENTLTTPEVDRVNPYFLKKGVQKELENKTDLNNNSYEEALNKAAKKLAKDPHAFDDLLIHNASDIHKKDEKLQTKEVKKGNHVDKDNGMKKMKGQTAPKATASSTKENRKGKPKGVKVMPDKGVTGSEKIIKEISSFIKKNLTENNQFNEFHQGMEVETSFGSGIVKEIHGGTLTVETKDGKLVDVQMNHVTHFANKKKEEAESATQEPMKEIGHEESVSKLYDALNRLEDLPEEVKTPDILDLIEKIKAKIDQLHNPNNFTQPTDDEIRGLEESFEEDEDLEIGDRIKVTYGNQFYGMTGTIEDFSRSGEFVIVSIDDHDGEYSMHSSDVEKIEDDYQDDYEDLDEAMDLNDPALVAARARIQNRKDNPPMSLAQALDQRDKDFEIAQEIKALKSTLRQTLIDMEQEAEPEGGPIADDYADRIMDLQNQIKALEAQLHEEDLEESGVEFKIPGASSPTYTSTSDAAGKEAELRKANIRFTKRPVG